MYRKLKSLIFNNWKRQTVIVITFTCLLINIFAITLYFKNEEINESDQWIKHSYEILRDSRLFLTQVQDMEIGEHGYLLTGHKEFLGPYENARKDIDAQMAKLRDMVKDNPEQVKKLDNLDPLLKARNQLLDSQIKKFQQNKQTLTVGDLDRSRMLMAKMRAQIEDFIDEEKDLLAQREKETTKNRNNYVQRVIFGSLLAIIGLLGANGLTVYYANRGRKAEDDLRRSHELYNIVTQGINEGIYEYDLTNDSVYYSPGFKRMLGYEPNEFPNSIQSFNEHIHPDDFNFVWEKINKFLDGETSEYRNYFRMQHKDGHYIWVMSRGIGIRGDNGEIAKIVGTHTDISEQKEREEYLKMLNTELENFTYITSHDLRSPLVNLKGFAGELEYCVNTLKAAVNDIGAKIPAEKRELIARITEKDIPEAIGYIKTAVERLDQLTGAILDLSRIGKAELKLEKINVTELVHKIIETMSFEINNKKISVIVKPLPDVRSDAMALRQVFSNIIDNAIKYLDETRPGIITISGTALPGESTFNIADNGRGISDIDKEKVFDMFKRARNVDNVRGVGMGMSFVKATIQRLGGKIWLESALGSGTTFTFSIPNKTRKEAI